MIPLQISRFRANLLGIVDITLTTDTPARTTPSDVDNVHGHIHIYIYSPAQPEDYGEEAIIPVAGLRDLPNILCNHTREKKEKKKKKTLGSSLKATPNSEAEPSSKRLKKNLDVFFSSSFYSVGIDR